LEKVVQQQNLSPEEVIRMNTDHEALTQSIKELGRRIAESRSQIMALEVAVANRGAAAEEAVDTYTGLLFSLQLDQELALELNTAADAPEELLVGADVRSIVRPSLNRLAEESRRERARVESEKLGIEHLLDGLVADCENEEAQIAAVARDIAKLTDEADVIREVG
jgi:kinetochore protein NDC80